MQPMFLTDLTWRQIGVQSYIIRSPLVFRSAVLGMDITVPMGFITDGESCPRWLPVINALFGNIADEPAVIHDWLYYTAICSREDADKVLLEAMKTIPEFPAWRQYSVYYGLRAGGFYAWYEHRRLGHSSIYDFSDNIKTYLKPLG